MSGGASYLPHELGIVPVKELLLMSRLFRLSKRPDSAHSAGMVPPMLMLFIQKICSCDRSDPHWGGKVLHRDHMMTGCMKVP